MARYRKKPVVIEAVQFTDDATEIIDWVLDNGGTARYHEYVDATEDDAAEPEFIAVDTLEGTMKASAGDWVVKGLKGEFYPCKPDIFAASYDAVGTYEPDKLALADTALAELRSEIGTPDQAALERAARALSD